MGCGQSSLSPMDRMAYEYILTYIPIQCREAITNVSPRKFLDVYKKHLDAETHLQEEEYLAAILNECQAIEGLEVLLHRQEDNFIFADMYKLLSICYWKMGNIGLAFQSSILALVIRLKHTPTDYTEISLQYFRLSFMYLVQDKLNDAEECLIRAIIAARLSMNLSQAYIQDLELALVVLREQINIQSRQKPIIHHFTSNPDENPEHFLRRIATEMLPILTEIGSLEIDQTEYERLPDKQTETQVNDEILNDVIQNLEKYLKEDTFLCKFGTNGGSISFIAAYFKAAQMKTSSLSSVIIEAALTILINQMNNENMTDNEQFAVLKQLPFTISYTDNDGRRMRGVRVFLINQKNTSETQ